ncbi:MAG TPA: DUF493 domain-containing protein [Cytophagales bacterium]|jgi:putative lipoic acid-binding regulatory protein|nr:DUF493 domain-containing protein [Cytophagales bacterium]
MDEKWYQDFKEKLDGYYTWPAPYTFKFIVPKGKEEEVRALFPLHPATERESSRGRYTSLTFIMPMSSSDAVIAVYQKASVVEGLIAL